MTDDLLKIIKYSIEDLSKTLDACNITSCETIYENCNTSCENTEAYCLTFYSSDCTNSVIGCTDGLMDCLNIYTIQK